MLVLVKQSPACRISYMSQGPSFRRRPSSHRQLTRWEGWCLTWWIKGDTVSSLLDPSSGSTTPSVSTSLVGLIPMTLALFFSLSQLAGKLYSVVCFTGGQCWNWPKRTGGSAAEMFEILPRDWSLWPIFTQKWASVDMNWGGFNPPIQPCWWFFLRIILVAEICCF